VQVFTDIIMHFWDWRQG